MSARIVCLVILSCSATLSSGEVRGVVRDMFGSAIVGASVSVEAAQKQVSCKCDTRPDGTFYCGAVDPGSYKVSVRMRGFHERVVLAEVGDQPETVTVTLRLGRLFISRTSRIWGTISKAGRRSPPLSVVATAEFDDTISVSTAITKSGVFSLRIVFPGAYLVGIENDAREKRVRCRVEGNSTLYADLEGGGCVAVAR